MKWGSQLYISPMTKRRIREKEVHQESLLLKMKKEGITNMYLILTVIIVTRKVIMLETVLRREKGRVKTPETKIIIKEENAIK